MTWEANCRGLDEYGTPLVAVRGSEDMDAVERARLISASPKMYEALCNLENDDGSIPEHAWKLVRDAISAANCSPVDMLADKAVDFAKTLALAESHLEDNRPELALFAIRQALGRPEAVYMCVRCDRQLSERQIRGKTDEGYICCHCISKEVLG